MNGKKAARIEEVLYNVKGLSKRLKGG